MAFVLQQQSLATKFKVFTIRPFIGEGFPGGTVVKNLPANAGDARDAGSIPESERPIRGGNGIPLQYSCLKNSMGRETWQATVYGVAKSRTQLSIHTHEISL